MNGSAAQGELLQLEPGDIVQGTTVSSCSDHDQKWMIRAQKRADQRRLPGKPPIRLLFFKAYGVIRYAQSIEELQPCRSAQATIPTEAETPDGTSA